MLLLLPMLLILIAHGAWSIKKMEELVVDISTNLISNGNVKGRTTENFEITCNILGEKENYTMKFIWTKQDNFKLKLVYHVSSRDIILIDRTLGIRQLFNGREEFSECFDPKEVGYAPGCQNCNMLCMRLHKMSKVYTVGHVPTNRTLQSVAKLLTCMPENQVTNERFMVDSHLWHLMTTLQSIMLTMKKNVYHVEIPLLNGQESEVKPWRQGMMEMETNNVSNPMEKEENHPCFLWRCKGCDDRRKEEPKLDDDINGKTGKKLDEKRTMKNERQQSLHEMLPENYKEAQQIACITSHYTMTDGILYYIGLGDDSETKPEVPSSMKNEILEACHDDIFSGHFGFTKTIARVR
uniref:Integrase zinc-binding domain-containing protein n=1 Tax=Romanomermis culicivorax TaxID=13658 RepID=A0A915ILC0_ROMCU